MQIWAASDPALERVSGKYFVRRREKTPMRAALDVAAARRLWEESERIVSRTSPARAAS